MNGSRAGLASRLSLSSFLSIAINASSVTMDAINRPQPCFLGHLSFQNLSVQGSLETSLVEVLARSTMLRRTRVRESQCGEMNSLHDPWMTYTALSCPQVMLTSFDFGRKSTVCNLQCKTRSVMPGQPQPAVHTFSLYQVRTHSLPHRCYDRSKEVVLKRNFCTLSYSSRASVPFASTIPS